MIKLNLNNTHSFTRQELVSKYANQLNEAKSSLINKTCKGNDFIGWLDWPTSEFYSKDLPIINEVYDEWMAKGIKTVVVIGIGGSYIGIKGAIDMCTQEFHRKGMKVIYVSGLHTTYNASLLKKLERKNWGIVVISKSGTTFETAVNFRLFREKLYAKYGEEHASRIVSVTDRSKGVLKELSDKSGYRTLIIPDDIGGRYSTITPVGLMAMKLAGLDIGAVLSGWKDTMDQFKNQPSTMCDAMLYAAARKELLDMNKQVEVFTTYETNLRFIGEHYKQIFGESEGKQPRCLIPTLANHSEDLHSIGQLYQEGPKNFFETTLMYKSVKGYVEIPESSFNNDDGLDKLVGKELLQLNHWIHQSVVKAHDEIPNLAIELDSCDEYTCGALFAFMAIAAATSSLLLGVNPFNQPGVEAYKAELKKKIK